MKIFEYVACPLDQPSTDIIFSQSDTEVVNGSSILTYIDIADEMLFSMDVTITSFPSSTDKYVLLR